MDSKKLHETAEAFLSAWNSQDVDSVLDCYSDDLVYVDPNTRGAVEGRAAMRSYLTKLFADWTMTWALREAHLLDGGAGGAVLWHATFQRKAGGAVVEADGMDLVCMAGERIGRNEVYFDRTVLLAG
jgi:ketosteroid isomerase-like protein